MLRGSRTLWCPVHVLVLALLMKLSPALGLPVTPSSPTLPFPPPTPSLPPPSPSTSFPSSPSPFSLSSPPVLLRRAPVRPPSQAAGQRKGRVAKRSTRFYGSFYRLMQRHSRFLSQQAFVEKMFRLFDMNADNLIERDEFRAIMRLLGLIHSSY